jgi:hypothetical protein
LLVARAGSSCLQKNRADQRHGVRERPQRATTVFHAGAPIDWRNVILWGSRGLSGGGKVSFRQLRTRSLEPTIYGSCHPAFRDVSVGGLGRVLFQGTLRKMSATTGTLSFKEAAQKARAAGLVYRRASGNRCRHEGAKQHALTFPW